MKHDLSIKDGLKSQMGYQHNDLIPKRVNQSRLLTPLRDNYHRRKFHFEEGVIAPLRHIKASNEILIKK